MAQGLSINAMLLTLLEEERNPRQARILANEIEKRGQPTNETNIRVAVYDLRKKGYRIKNEYGHGYHMEG